MTFCAACSVDTGRCPDCGTVWLIGPNGKRYGERPCPRCSHGFHDDRSNRSCWVVNGYTEGQTPAYCGCRLSAGEASTPGPWFSQGPLIHGPDAGGIDIGPLIGEMADETDARYVVGLVNAAWRDHLRPDEVGGSRHGVES